MCLVSKQSAWGREENSVHLRLQSSHCCWEASMSLRLHVACDSARHAWHTGCVSSLYDGICCHPVVWIVTLCCHTVMADWYDSQTGRHPPLGPVFLLRCHLQLTTNAYRGWTVSENHRKALITVELPLLRQDFSYSTVLQTEVKNLNQILLLLSFPALLKSCVPADHYVFWKICAVENQILLGWIMWEYTFWIQIF